MIGLVTTNMKLEIILGGAVATNQLPFVVTYENRFASREDSLSVQHGATNSANAVTMVTAPSAGEQRYVKSISVHNEDTANATVTVRLNDNATTRTIVKYVLTPTDSLYYEDGTGWYIL